MHSLVQSHDGAFEVDYDRVLSGYISLITLGSGVTRFEAPAIESFSALEIDVSQASGTVHFRDIRASFVSASGVLRQLYLER